MEPHGFSLLRRSSFGYEGRAAVTPLVSSAKPHIKTFQPRQRPSIGHFERRGKSPPIAEQEISPKGRNDKGGVEVTEIDGFELEQPLS